MIDNIVGCDLASSVPLAQLTFLPACSQMCGKITLDLTATHRQFVSRCSVISLETFDKSKGKQHSKNRVCQALEWVRTCKLMMLATGVVSLQRPVAGGQTALQGQV